MLTQKVRAVLRIRREPAYRRLAFEQGLKRVGFVLDDKLTRPDGPESWAILWNRQGENEVFADAWEARGGTVIVCENGYLSKTDKTHYAISVHGHNGSGWTPFDPGEDRFSALGFELKPWRGVGKYQLVCGQRSIGSRTMRSPPGWAEKMDGKLRRQGLPTKLRLHPGNFSPKVPLVDDLRGAVMCLIWSSAAGVRAIVEGVPVAHYAPHWICSGANEATRAAVLARMAQGQWHHDEVSSGEPFARVIANRSKAVW